MTIPDSNPSNPSSQLKAFIVPTMHMIVINKLEKTDNSIIGKFIKIPPKSSSVKLKPSIHAIRAINT